MEQCNSYLCTFIFYHMFFLLLPNVYFVKSYIVIVAINIQKFKIYHQYLNFVITAALLIYFFIFFDQNKKGINMCFNYLLTDISNSFLIRVIIIVLIWYFELHILLIF